MNDWPKLFELFGRLGRKHSATKVLFRPQLEALEKRELLTTFQPDTLFDEPDPISSYKPGHVYQAFGSISESRATALDNNGKILMAGHTFVNVTPFEQRSVFAIARLINHGTVNDGELDSTFSGDGIVRWGFDPGVTAGQIETINAIAVQPNGQILVAGVAWANQMPPSRSMFAVMRFNPDGTPDTSFGGQLHTFLNNVEYQDDPGEVSIRFGPNNGAYARDHEIFGIDFEIDDVTGEVESIVVAGWADMMGDSGRHMAVAKLNPDGTPFPVDGFQDFQPGNAYFRNGIRAEAHDVEVLDDGSIVVVGQDALAGSPNDFIVAKLTPGLQIDSSFGDTGGPNAGYRRIEFKLGTEPARSDIAWDMVLQDIVGDPNQRIVVVGTTSIVADPSNSNFATARLTHLGALDPTFGESIPFTSVRTGKTTLNINHTDVAYGVDLQPQINPQDPPLIVFGGYSVNSSTGTPYMSGARVNQNGTDASTAATFASNFPNQSTGMNGDRAWQIKVEPTTRKILAGGFHTETSGVPGFGIIRLLETPMSGLGGGGEGSGGSGAGAYLVYGTDTVSSTEAAPTSEPSPSPAGSADGGSPPPLVEPSAEPSPTPADAIATAQEAELTNAVFALGLESLLDPIAGATDPLASTTV